MTLTLPLFFVKSANLSMKQRSSKLLTRKLSSKHQRAKHALVQRFHSKEFGSDVRAMPARRVCLKPSENLYFKEI